MLQELDQAPPAPLSVGEILTRLERRLDWYGVPQSGLQAVELRPAGAVVATLSVPGQGTFREVLDPWTGAVRARQRLGFLAGLPTVSGRY